jgi:glycerophosphoryl diester phosphodiesterase
MSDFTVIAHRGASAYLPEHTLAGAAMAHAMGADFIELDVVLTRDRQLVVLHDLYLDAVTDVADRFHARARMDGHYYAIDFTLDEIRSLRLRERVTTDGSPEFSGRFPASGDIFRIPSLEDEIIMIQGLNKSTGKDAGLYIEPKAPTWHAKEGSSIFGKVLDLLAKYGYRARKDKACVQSFDMAALKRARFELASDLKLVQLIGENSWRESDTDFDYLRSSEGLEEISGFADGIGPWLPHIVDFKQNGVPDISDLIRNAHRLGLFVHAYTLRADQLPAEVSGIQPALDILLQTGLDGVFTDHPDRVVRYLESGY